MIGISDINISLDVTYPSRLIFISFFSSRIRIVLFLGDFFEISTLWIAFLDLFLLLCCFCVILFFCLEFCLFSLFLSSRNLLVSCCVCDPLNLLLWTWVHLNFAFFEGCHRCVWEVIWLNFSEDWTLLVLFVFVVFVNFFSWRKRNVKLRRWKNRFFYFWFNLIFWCVYRSEFLWFSCNLCWRRLSGCWCSLSTWFYFYYFIRSEKWVIHEEVDNSLDFVFYFPLFLSDSCVEVWDDIIGSCNKRINDSLPYKIINMAVNNIALLLCTFIIAITAQGVLECKNGGKASVGHCLCPQNYIGETCELAANPLS